MAHFAEIDQNNIVVRVLVVDNEYENIGADFLANQLNLGGRWIQTSYNANIRKNFAGLGYFYDEQLDAFIPPKPYPSWTLNLETCQWIPPKPYPDVTKKFMWDEQNGEWLNVEVE